MSAPQEPWSASDLWSLARGLSGVTFSLGQFPSVLVHTIREPPAASSISKLDLHGSHLSSAQARPLGWIISQSYVTLSHLDLSMNSLGPEGIHLLFKGLSDANCLRVLNLSENDLGDEGAMLVGQAVERCCDLRELHLRQNGIRFRGCSSLCEALSFHKSITSLDLHGNPLGDEGMSSLASYLSCNPIISNIRITQTSSSKAGIHAIWTSLAINHSVVNVEVDSDFGQPLARRAGINSEFSRSDSRQRLVSQFSRHFPHEGQGKQVLPLRNQLRASMSFKMSPKQWQAVFYDMLPRRRVLYCRRIIESNAMQCVLALASIVSVFLDDTFDIAYTNELEYMALKFGIASVCIVLFLVEVGMRVCCERDFFLSFYFWLDGLAILSLVPVALEYFAPQDHSLFVYVRPARVARVAGQATRLTRLVSSFVRGVKVCSRPGKSNGRHMDPTHIGQLMHSKTTIKSVLIVGSVFVALLLIHESSPNRGLSNSYALTALQKVHSVATKSNGFSSEVSEFDSASVNSLFGHDAVSLLVVEGKTLYSNNYLLTMCRDEDREAVSSPEGSVLEICRMQERIEEAMLSSLRLIVFISVLLIGAISFSLQTEQYVARPLENMIELIKSLVDPAAVLQSVVRRQRRRARGMFQLSPKLQEELGPHLGPFQQQSNNLETDVITASFIRFGELLNLSFGDAGSSIVANALGQDGDFDPVSEGRIVDGIFSFSDIRNFTTITECLEESIMMFTNEIASYLHESVVLYGGIPNKNVGDAFFSVWKRESDECSKPGPGDRSLIAICKTLWELSQSPTMKQFAQHPKLVKRMGEFQVKLGTALHSGLAVEGAIGTRFKLDASYLSKHVAITEQLENLTKVYNVPILLSESFLNSMTKGIRDKCRWVDRIRFLTDEVLDIYTPEVDLKLTFAQRSMEQSWESATMISANDLVFFTSAEESQLQREIKKSYLSKDFGRARECLLELMSLRNNLDGPCEVLLQRIVDISKRSPLDLATSHAELLNELSRRDLLEYHSQQTHSGRRGSHFFNKLKLPDKHLKSPSVVNGSPLSITAPSREASVGMHTPPSYRRGTPSTDIPINFVQRGDAEADHRRKPRRSCTKLCCGTG